MPNNESHAEASDRAKVDFARSQPGLRLSQVELRTMAYLSDPALRSLIGEDGKLADGTQILPELNPSYEAGRAKIEEKKSAGDRAEWQFGPFTCAFCDTGEVELIAYAGDSAFVDLPAAVQGAPVVSLSSELFLGHAELEGVYLPDGIREIGHRLFGGCRNLKAVRFPATLVQVGSGLFSHCGVLDEVRIEADSPKIVEKCLAGSNLRRIAFGPGLRDAAGMRLEVTGLEAVIVDAGNPFVASDGVSLFSRDGRVLLCALVERERYEIPAGCVEVSDKAFDSMGGLRKVAFPQGLASIGKLAFAKTGLEQVVFPESLELVGEKAFYHCASLREVRFPRGLRSIGEGAFAHGGILRARLGSRLHTLGFDAFADTPLQRSILDGALGIAKDNPFLRVDPAGALYRGDALVELIGLVRDYQVDAGTRRIAAGACKRHQSLERVVLPEGLREIGADAFRNNRRLREVNLPRTLERIGARAFLDTSIREFILPARLGAIGDGALVVHGENQLAATGTVRSVQLEEGNERFYLESGVLCERCGAPDGGDAVVLYGNRESCVRIPREVTQINAFAFCGADGLDELWLHCNVRSICLGALSTARCVDVLHLEFSQEVQGFTEVTLPMPRYTTRFRTMMPLFSAHDKKTHFDFAYYDKWVSCTTDIAEFARAAYARLTHPVRLYAHAREVYANLFRRKGVEICRYFAKAGDIDALQWLCAQGHIERDAVDRALEAAFGQGNPQLTACLMELRRRVWPQGAAAALDMDLDL